MEIIKINSEKHGLFDVMVDDDDFEELSKYIWFISKIRNKFYVRRKGCVLMHRQIMNPESGKVVDHIDHNGLNNQKSNLRVCTNSENRKNTSINTIQTLGSTSKYKGVCWYKRDSKWRANIQVNKLSIHLGFFDIEVEAAKAYNDAAIKYFGEFACLNDIE